MKFTIPPSHSGNDYRNNSNQRDDPLVEKARQTLQKLEADLRANHYKADSKLALDQDGNFVKFKFRKIKQHTDLVKFVSQFDNIYERGLSHKFRKATGLDVRSITPEYLQYKLSRFIDMAASTTPEDTAEDIEETILHSDMSNQELDEIHARIKDLNPKFLRDLKRRIEKIYNEDKESVFFTFESSENYSAMFQLIDQLINGSQPAPLPPTYDDAVSTPPDYDERGTPPSYQEKDDQNPKPPPYSDNN